MNADVICQVEGFKLLTYIYVILHIINTVKPPIHWKLGRKYLQNYLTEFQAGLWGISQKIMWKLSSLNFPWQTPSSLTHPTPPIMWHHVMSLAWHSSTPQNIPGPLFCGCSVKNYMTQNHLWIFDSLWVIIFWVRFTRKMLNVTCIQIHSIILSVTCHGLGNFPLLIHIPSKPFVNFLTLTQKIITRRVSKIHKWFQGDVYE